MPNMGMKSSRRRSAAKKQGLDIASALFTTTQRKLLDLLYGDPARSYFASEIIELAKAGSGAVQRELARLAESGLVTQELIGRQRHYQANPAAPVFEELKSIIAKTSGIPSLLRNVLQPVADRIKLALVYGSIAKGESKSSSDIDLLVVSDELLLEDLYRSLENAETKLRRKINPTLYSLGEFQKRIKEENPFLTKVLNGTVLAVIGSVDAPGTAR